MSYFLSKIHTLRFSCKLDILKNNKNHKGIVIRDRFMLLNLAFHA